MPTGSKRTIAADAARPERRASKRLAADLMRFEKAFERLERGHMGINPPDDEAAAAPIVERDVRAYLNCLDEAIRQLAEEFAEDATIGKLIKERETRQAAEMGCSIVADEAVAISAEPPAAASPGSKPMPRPNCVAFDAAPGEATSLPAISQVDTSAV